MSELDVQENIQAAVKNAVEREREACAKIAHEVAVRCDQTTPSLSIAGMTALEIERRIRERGAEVTAQELQDIQGYIVIGFEDLVGREKVLRRGVEEITEERWGATTILPIGCSVAVIGDATDDECREQCRLLEMLDYWPLVKRLAKGGFLKVVAE